MFTTDVGDSPCIERFNMDGTGHRELVTTDISYPDPITVDPDEEFVLWFDYFNKALVMMDLDGGNRQKLVFEDTGFHHLFSSITVSSKTVFQHHCVPSRLDGIQGAQVTQIRHVCPLVGTELFLGSKVPPCV